MKKINKYIALGVGVTSLALTSCEDLDTKMLGGYVTTEQKIETLEKNPEMAQAAVTGIFSGLSTYMAVYSDHFDFGYPAIMHGLDLQGNEMVGPNSGYNWHSYWESFSSPTKSGTPSGMAWYHMYKLVRASNAVAATIPADTDNDLLKFYRAQAVGSRAWEYWVLAQLYQYNYKGNENQPCVPVITDLNSEQASSEGCARSTVQETYDQILADITEAINLLEATSVTPEQVIDSKANRLISKATAYGIRARVYLTMQEWSKAAADAQAAINAFGGRPYEISEVNHPAFESMNEPSWMWGIAIAETDRVVTSGIVNLPSFLGSFNYGYCTVGDWKWLNMNLYQNIPNTDVRKGWFLDEDLVSPNLTPEQTKYLHSYGDIPEYLQVKFNSYQGVLNQSTNATDVPLMRVEEMYYILAEAKAMSGDVTGGMNVLTNFVKTYRDPGFNKSADSGEEVQELVHKQRQIEFFGEGLSWFDTMRLGKGVDRRASNWPSAYTYYMAPDAPQLIYCIPTGEINGNPLIGENDANPESSRPQPVI